MIDSDPSAATPLGEDAYLAMLRRRQAAQDPERQYLVGALQSLRQEPERSAGQLGENLLAAALYQYALRQHDQPDAPTSIDPGQPLEGLLPAVDGPGEQPPSTLSPDVYAAPALRDDPSTLDLGAPPSQAFAGSMSTP